MNALEVCCVCGGGGGGGDSNSNSSASTSSSFTTTSSSSSSSSTAGDDAIRNPFFGADDDTSGMVAAPAPPPEMPAPLCISTLGWISIDGENCAYYADRAFCTEAGLIGPGWETGWGQVEDYTPKTGISAWTACCGCGGGRRRPTKGSATGDEAGDESDDALLFGVLGGGLLVCILYMVMALGFRRRGTRDLQGLPDAVVRRNKHTKKRTFLQKIDLRSTYTDASAASSSGSITTALSSFGVKVESKAGHTRYAGVATIAGKYKPSGLLGPGDCINYDTIEFPLDQDSERGLADEIMCDARGMSGVLGPADCISYTDDGSAQSAISLEWDLATGEGTHAVFAHPGEFGSENTAKAFEHAVTATLQSKADEATAFLLLGMQQALGPPKAVGFLDLRAGTNGTESKTCDNFAGSQMASAPQALGPPKAVGSLDVRAGTSGTEFEDYDNFDFAGI